MRIYRKEHADAFEKKEQKYFDLVWYARSPSKKDTAYWDKVPEDIREKALNAQARVQEAYPYEVSALSDDWNHRLQQRLPCCLPLYSDRNPRGRRDC